MNDANHCVRCDRVPVRHVDCGVAGIRIVCERCHRAGPVFHAFLDGDQRAIEAWNRENGALDLPPSVHHLLRRCVAGDPDALRTLAALLAAPPPGSSPCA